LHVSKAKCAKSIELQEKKHTALQKGAQLKSKGANMEFQIVIFFWQASKRRKIMTYVALAKPKIGF
jgi:hypothetical protein